MEEVAGGGEGGNPPQGSPQGSPEGSPQGSPQEPGAEKERRGFARFKPLKVGEEIDVKVETKGGKGDGIAKVKGLVLFVPGGEVGQDVRVKITKVLRNFAVGEIIA